MNKTSQELHEMSVPELKAYVAEIELKLKGNPSKETLIEKILARQEDTLADYEAPEVELTGYEFVPVSLELVTGEIVKRDKILPAVVRDLEIDNSEWNELTDKDKERKVKAFIGTLDLKRDEPEAPVETKVSKGTKEHVEKLLAPFTERGLKTEYDDQGVTFSYGIKKSWTSLSVPDHVLISQARSAVL